MSDTQSKDLLAELDAEFGKAARPKRKPNGFKDANKTFHQRIDVGGFEDDVAYANAIAKGWHTVPGFHAVATVHRVHSQSCRTCGHSIDYIANEFTRFENKRMHITVDAAQMGYLDHLGFELPQFVETHYNEVETCASCLRLSRNAGELAEILTAVNGVPTQRNLWS